MSIFGRLRPQSKSRERLAVEEDRLSSAAIDARGALRKTHERSGTGHNLYGRKPPGTYRGRAFGSPGFSRRRTGSRSHVPGLWCTGLADLSSQLYISWDKILADLEISHFGRENTYRERIKTVRTRLLDPAANRSEVTDDDRWISVPESRHTGLSKKISE